MSTMLAIIVTLILSGLGVALLAVALSDLLDARGVLDVAGSLFLIVCIIGLNVFFAMLIMAAWCMTL